VVELESRLRVADAVCEQMAEDLTTTEAMLVRAIAEAASYRHLALCAISELAETSTKVGVLERRIRQMNGIDPWSGETVA
jgi:hypothetical protein